MELICSNCFEKNGEILIKLFRLAEMESKAGNTKEVDDFNSPKK